jgi:glycosyltransferase involved in cell wall biosynthesis
MSGGRLDHKKAGAGPLIERRRTALSTSTRTSKLRILVAVQGGAGTKVTGPEIRGWAVAQALAERHDVTVALHDPPAQERDGMRLIRFSRRALAHQARRHDVVVAPVLPPYLFAALRGSSTITVSDQYDPIWLELSLFADQPEVARVLRAQRMIRDAQVRFADIIAVAGEGQRGLLLDDLGMFANRRATPPTVVSVPFGISAPPPPSSARPIREHFPEIGPDDPVVLWWGKVWKWFDAETAIRAFALVVKRRPDARLVISAGKAPKANFDRSERSEDARELSRELGLLGRNVFFLDEWTPYDTRHTYLGDADIGLTLHADTPEAPFAARARYMDYLWAGLPCVLAAGDEIADRFGAAGFARLVAPGAAEQAADAILELIEQPQQHAAARAAGLGLAEEYRWSALVRPLAEAIEERAATRGRSSSDRLVRAVGRYYVRRTVDHAAALARSGSR